MISVSIPTGPDHIVANSEPVTLGNFGYNFTGFRSFDRFSAQMADSSVGLITWPGGSIAELRPDIYDLNHDDLWNGANDFGVDRLFAEAAGYGAGVAITIPTKRYVDAPEALRADLGGFLDRLLSGEFGPPPGRVILEIGSEYYGTFGTGPENAAVYGRLAEDMVGIISDAVSDPARNPDGLDIEIAVQTGRTTAEDEAIREQLSDETLRNIDMLIYHRFSPVVAGIDRTIETLDDNMESWEADMVAAGGARPSIFMSSYNVASYTRSEALDDYIAGQASLGNVIDPSSIDLDARTDDGFEEFWQSSLTTRHYGIEQTRVLMELHAHVGSLGLGAAAVYGIDMLHPARLSFSGVDGEGHDFVGQDVLDMMQEATIGTRLLDVSIQNDQANENLWLYGYENDDKLIAFIAWHDLEPGLLQVNIPELTSGKYKAVWTEALHGVLRPDWMEHFGIPDNPNVDEGPEGLSFVEGVREDVPISLQNGALIVNTTKEHQILRLSFAKTDAGFAEIDAFEAEDPLLLGADPLIVDDGSGQPPDDDDDGPEPDGGSDGAGMGAGLGGALGLLLLVAAFAAGGM